MYGTEDGMQPWSDLTVFCFFGRPSVIAPALLQYTRACPSNISFWPIFRGEVVQSATERGGPTRLTRLLIGGI